MTREEAIEVIRKEYACVDADCDIERSCGKCELHMPSKEPILKAYEMAIQALSQEPCDDAVSREAVIEWLENATYEDISYAVGTELSFLPPVTQKSIECDDTISRKDAEEMFRNIRSHLKPQDYKSAEEFNTRDLMLLNAEQMIHALPSVTQKPKTGHWVNAKVGKLFPSNDFKCSECGNILDFNGVNCGRGDAKYCPNCGARMESEEISERNMKMWEELFKAESEVGNE